MPDTKISQFSTAASFNATDLITGLQGGVNVNWTGSSVEAFILRAGGTLAGQMAAKAPLDSPIFTNSPQAPTATPGNNSNILATTAFVTAAVASAAGGGAVIQNQSTAMQNPGTFWISGPGKISSNGTPTMEWEQLAGAGYGIFIPFKTSTIPLGYFSLGDSGLPNALLNISIPSTSQSVALSVGMLELEGFYDDPTGRFVMLRLNDLALVKNYNNADWNEIGTNAVAIWDFQAGAYRLCIKSNGNWIVGGGITDNGARFQVEGGTLSFAKASSDYPVVDGSMFYRQDTGKLRGAVAGAWKNILTEGDLVDYAPLAKRKFISANPYTVVPADDGQILVWGTAGPLVFNVAMGLRDGFQCEVWQDSDDPITFTDAGGAVIHSRGELKNTAGKYAGVTLCHLIGGQFRLAGDLA